MKVHEFISSLDEAKYGRRRVAEDTVDVAKSPSHAPTSSAGYKTPSSGKSKDEGEKNGGEKDAIKKSETSIPAPIAKAPSHNPTSSAGYKTSGEGKSKDEGEKISKEAMKENLIRDILDSDGDVDVAALIAQADISEGGHKAGCQCGFCKNKGKFGKKKDEGGEGGEKEEGKEDMQEHAMPPMRPMGGKPPMRAMGGKPPMARPGAAPAGRMGFRHPAAPRTKALGTPAKYLSGGPYASNQPSMEKLDSAKDPSKAIQEMADKLLPAPGQR